MKEKCTAQTNMKFYANTVVNGMSEKKIIAQPSVRHLQKKKRFAKKIIAQPSVIHLQKKKNHSPKMYRYKKKAEEIKDTQVDREKVKINGKYSHMQVNTGSDITLIPVNFWQDLGKPRLKTSALQPKQFDGTIIKTLGTFKGTFETKNCFEIIPITIEACTKDHELLGKDILEVDTLKLVNSMESEEQEIGLLKGYKASICLKENYHPSKMITHTHLTYCSIKAKKKMIQQGILEKVTHGRSD